MPTYSARSAVTAFGKQAAEGTALTTPKFEIPMGGGFAGPERSTAELPWTNETQDSVGDYVERVGGVVDMTLPVLPVSCVGLFEGVLGSRSTTGAGPYTHAITPSDTLPFQTFHYAQPGGNYWQVADVKLSTAQLSWSPGSPLELSISGMGKTTTRTQPATKWTTATLVEAIDPFYTMIGATMKFEGASTTPSTTVRNIAGGSITINRNIDPIQTDAINYQYMAEQKRDIEVSLDDVVFESNDLINQIFTGSTTGTTMSGQVVYGSCEFLFLGSDQVAAGTRSLKVTLPRVLWTIDQVPSADPGGATLRYTVTGRASKPSSGASITVTAINASAGAVYA
jgi:hypothetical protein